MVRLMLFLLLISSLALSGQDDFLRELSAEVCTCLDGNTSEPVARDCFEGLALRKSDDIWQGYQLDVSVATQRDKLAEMMVDYLLSACPLLETVRLKNDENEFRWADGLRSKGSAAQQFKARKRPLADTSTTITTESPLVWRATGTLITQPGSKGLHLRTAAQKELRFELPTAVARRRDFDPGDNISLTYRREWRIAEGKVVLVVVSID